MHKTIAGLILGIIEESPFKDYYKVVVYPKQTKGFWSMKIVAKSEKWVNYLGLIQEFAYYIGQFYSEHLTPEFKKRTLRIS